MSTTTTQHTPFVATCRCTIIHDPDGPEMGSWICYCPTHAAAPEMRGYLKRLIACADARKGHGTLNETADEARALLAKIEGR